MMDCSSKFALRTGDQLESAGKTEKDRQERPICNQLSSKLTVSKLIFTPWRSGARNAAPLTSLRLALAVIEIEHGLESAAPWSRRNHGRQSDLNGTSI